MKERFDKIMNKFNNGADFVKLYIKENKKETLKYFVVIFFVYFIVLIPLMLAKFNYIDDLGRTLNGNRSWDNFSRYGSQYISIFVHAGRHLTDISPFTLLISVFILTVASIILIYTLSDNKKFSFWKVVAVIPLGISPYFLECLSYKFDCVYMSISVFSCILPMIFYKKNNVIYFITTVLSIILMCITYQASSGIFPMLVIVLALKLWNDKEDNKDIVKFLITSGMAYIFGVLIFKFGIMKGVNSYVSNSLFPVNELIPGAIENFKKYLSIVKSDSTKYWLILAIVVPISFIITSNIKSRQKLYYSIPLSFVALVMTFVLCFGLYPLLEKPLFAPRAMYGFWTFFAIIGVYAVDLKINYIAKISCFLLAWLFVNFAMTYGNALAEQKRYTEFRVQTLINDMSDCEIFGTDEQKNVAISGNIGKSPVIRNMKSKYKILDKLVPNTLGEKWTWAEYYFFNYFDLKHVKKSSSYFDKKDMVLIKKSMYQNIYANGNDVLIILK